MSADQILRTGIGNVAAVFHSGRGRNRASCSCGWDGPLRMLLPWALLDAWGHVGRSPGCLPSEPLVATGTTMIDCDACGHSMASHPPCYAERLRHRLKAKALWVRLTPWWVLVGSILLLIPAGMLAPEVRADPLPANCEQIPWGFFGSQRRMICDGPIRPDGSWERERVIGVPAHYRNASSECSSGSYSSRCTFYPAGWVEQVTVEDSVYVVFPFNVLPNEPGHLG